MAWKYETRGSLSNPTFASSLSIPLRRSVRSGKFMIFILPNGSNVLIVHPKCEQLLHTRTNCSKLKSRLTRNRPDRPISLQSSRFARLCANESSSAIKSEGVNKRPDWPCSTSSGIPATRLATTGLPKAKASLRTTGRPSMKLRSTRISLSAIATKFLISGES